MRLRKLLTFLIVTLVAFTSAITVPTVRAQSTSITHLTAPSTVVVGESVTVRVGATYDLGSNGYAVSIGIFDLDAWWAYGTATSEENTCHQSTSGQAALQAYCGYIPSTPSGSDVVIFLLTFSTVKTYRLRASVELYDSHANLISSASTFQDFSIVVSAMPSQSSGTVSGTVSISNFQYPTTVLLGQQATVSFTVSFSGFTPGVTYLIVGVQNADGSSWASGSVVSSSPDNCPEPTEQDRGLAVCFYQPVESQGSEDLAFSLTVNSAGTFSSYGVEAEPALRSSSCSSDWCFGQSQYTSSFTIQAVTSLPPSSTTSTAGVSASDATMYLEILMCGLVIIVVGVIVYHVYGSKRRKETQAEKVETAVTPLSTKTGEGKRFCIECGNEVPPNLKFCDSCGAKQS